MALRTALSSSPTEARRAVLGLYRAWYREVPHILEKFRLDVTVDQARQQLRKHFLKNKDVTDVRVIDLLVVKGKQELQETVKIWKQRTHVMRFFDDFNDVPVKSSNDFMARFLEGTD